MVSIQLDKTPRRGGQTAQPFVLRVAGLLDGSAAWRIVRLALRLSRDASSRRSPAGEPLVLIDLSDVDRMMTFAAEVLAVGLPRASAEIVAVRPEHRRLLVGAGVIADEAEPIPA